MVTAAAWFHRPMGLRIDVQPGVARQPDEEFAAACARPATACTASRASRSATPTWRCAGARPTASSTSTWKTCASGGWRATRCSTASSRSAAAPHSKFDAPYQRRGLASAIYRWGLDAGLCLVTGARQSEGAHALWHKLGRDYPLGHVELRDKALRYLGPTVAPEVLGELHTRMLLLGRPWTLARFAAATGMR